MSGFDNEVLYADNVDFTGNSQVQGQMTQNGQLLIGASSAPFIRAANITSAGNTLTIANGPGTIDISINGPVSVAKGGTGSSSFTAYAVICAGIGSTDPFQNVSGLGNAGQVLTSNGAGTLPTWEDSSGGGLSWNEETGASVNAVVNNGYITNRGGGVTVNLPATFAVGDIIRVVGKTGLWIVDAPAGDTIQFGDGATSSGGTLTATNAGDCVELIGITADTTWRVMSSMGNITVA